MSVPDAPGTNTGASDRTDAPGDSQTTGDSQVSTSPRRVEDPLLTAIRTACVLTGLAVIAFGAVQVGSQLGAASIIGLLGWLAGAVIIHDGLLVPAVTAIGRILFGPASPPTSTPAPTPHPTPAPVRTWSQAQSQARFLRRFPTLALTRALIVAACLISVVVLPEIWAQGRGTANPTILPGRYAESLLGVWIIVLGLSTLVLIGGILGSLRSSTRR